jgi:glyoxylase I family protein
MKIEHLAYMAEDPVAVAAWYVDHLGFSVKRKTEGSPFAHFLADGSGRVMLEVYNNPAATVPDYASMNPLVLHLAFSVDDVAAERQRLIEAGAAPEGEAQIPAQGDHVAMLRDPWGFPVQLVKRAEPMVPLD